MIFFFLIFSLYLLSLEKLLIFIIIKIIINFWQSCSKSLFWIPEWIGIFFSLSLSFFLVSRDFSRYLVKYVRDILAEFIIRLNIKIPYS